MLAGLGQSLEQGKESEYLKLADWLEARYDQYGPGILYLRRLAGGLARPVGTVPPLEWLSPRFIQRAGRVRVQLDDPLDADAHDLRVCFHRL